MLQVEFLRHSDADRRQNMFFELTLSWKWLPTKEKQCACDSNNRAILQYIHMLTRFRCCAKLLCSFNLLLLYDIFLISDRKKDFIPSSKVGFLKIKVILCKKKNQPAWHCWSTLPFLTNITYLSKPSELIFANLFKFILSAIKENYVYKINPQGCNKCVTN